MYFFLLQSTDIFHQLFLCVWDTVINHDLLTTFMYVHGNY